MFDSAAFDVLAFSEDAFLFEDVDPVVVTPDVTGGASNWYDILENQRRRRERQRKEDDELEEIPDRVEREIAKLMHKDAEQAEKQRELERIGKLVAQQAIIPAASDRVNIALEQAKAKQTLASYEKLQREYLRMLEDEEVSVMLSLLL